MRILHVDTGKEWRGGQRQALFLHSGLTARGHESLMVCSPDGELIKRAENTEPLSFRSEADPVYIFRLLSLIRKFRPDIVHSHDSHSLTPCIASSWLNGSFRLVHTRRVDFPLKKKLFNKYRSGKVNLVAISKAIQDIIASSGIPKDRISLIYSGSDKPETVDTVLAAELRQKFNPRGRKVIGTVANFADHKDYPTLLRAFDRLCADRQDVLLLPVGDGPMFDEIKAYADTLKCRENIVFTGFCSHIPEILSLMDIFTMTSKTEGLCTSIIDAMNASLPVVATAAGGIPELVTEGENGFLCKVGDDAALAAAYGRLLDDEPLRGMMAENSLKRAYSFSAEKMVLSYIELYEKLLK
ncbi:MAG: glycosyltransferase [Deferribacterales bacterium]